MSGWHEVDILPIFRLAEIVRFEGTSLGYVKAKNPQYLDRQLRPREDQPRFFHRNAWMADIQGLILGFEITDHFVRDILSFPAALPGQRIEVLGWRPNGVDERVYELIAPSWAVQWTVTKTQGYHVEPYEVASQGTRFMHQRVGMEETTLRGDFDGFRRDLTMLTLMMDFTGLSREINYDRYGTDNHPDRIRLPMRVNP